MGEIDEGQHNGIHRDQMGSREKLTKQVSVRLSEPDMERLDALADRISNSSRNAIARAAIRIGLAELEANPTKLVTEAEPRPPHRRRRGRS